MKKSVPLLLLTVSILILFAAASCASGVSQSDYDALNTKLEQAEAQLKTLQGTSPTTLVVTPPAITVSTTPGDNSAKTIDDLKKQIDSYTAQIAALDSRYKASEANLAALNAKYAALEAANAALSKPPEDITETKVEQAIFAMINQERAAANVPELGWGTNLYSIVRQHGKYMAENGKFEVSSWPFFQQIYWATGYSSVNNLAGAVLTIWKNNEYQFEHGILSKAFKYGAIGAYKYGTVFYITFMAADVP
jgi:uncharacterized protein YkwD